jgi:hypothetical protein
VFIGEYFSDDQIATMLQSSGEHATAERVAIAAALQYYLERTSLIDSNSQEDKTTSKRWQTVQRMLHSSFLP